MSKESALEYLIQSDVAPKGERNYTQDQLIEFANSYHNHMTSKIRGKKTNIPENQNHLIQKAYSNILWMAIRYAHGRHTYAPDLVRESLQTIKQVYPNYNPLKNKKDITIKPPTQEYLKNNSLAHISDYLHDLYQK